jgi:hypothetical protein
MLCHLQIKKHKTLLHLLDIPILLDIFHVKMTMRNSSIDENAFFFGMKEVYYAFNHSKRYNTDRILFEFSSNRVWE